MSWVYINPEEASVIAAAMAVAGPHPVFSAIAQKMNDLVEDESNKAQQDLYGQYRDAARMRLSTFGSDDSEVDGDAIVSEGDDAGAYVHAWIWVTDEQAGIETNEDEDLDETETGCDPQPIQPTEENTK